MAHDWNRAVGAARNLYAISAVLAMVLSTQSCGSEPTIQPHGTSIQTLPFTGTATSPTSTASISTHTNTANQAAQTSTAAPLPGDTSVFPWGVHWVPCKRDAQPELTLQGNISGEHVWTGTIHLKGEVRVQPGSTLKVSAGTHIIAHPGAKLTFEGSFLRMAGSDLEPIVFCGMNPERGSWHGIELTGAPDHVSFSRVSIQDAQTGVKSEPKLDLFRVDVQNASTAGFDLRTIKDSLVKIHVARSNTAIIGRSPGFFGELYENFSFEGHDNLLNGFEIGFSTWNQGFDLGNYGLPYFVRSNVRIVGNTEIRFGQGAEVQFDPGVTLTVGDGATHSRLFVLGSILFPVKLKPRLGNEMGWGGIKAQAIEFTVIDLENTEIEGVQENFAIEALSPNVEAEDITLVDCPKGIYVDSQYFPTLRRIHFKGKSDVGLSVPSNRLKNISDLNFSDNQGSSIVLRKGYFFEETKIVNYGVPYILDNGLYIDSGETVTIEPGTQLLVRCGDTPVKAEYDGNLIAVGQAGQEIVFSGIEKRSGCWPGITLDNKKSSSTKLKHVIVEYAGLRDQAMLRAWTPSIVRQCTFRHTQGPAIEKRAADTTDYESSNQFVDIGQENIRILPQEFRALDR